ncbi:ubiquitin-conjugating enzyme [Klebsormidium nitens]|uniref:E2 ubiquitin-conjugating enzyme n=1 Tax=Klebsormidium nitens TaxID=105231 RepID=A0A1Y1I6Y0_KLENI|nr:ubiquitin-conjugating enzyme [Klebsormidium nitens]|eukprot:GAQ85692.1 ubiquitin-conjugating enzyme [Klebsormidium nitens]
MAQLDVNRIQKELVEIERDKNSGVSVTIIGGQLSRLTGTIKGPIGTPYEGGIFVVDITLTKSYPFEPPKMTFKTKVWHPNVSSANGAICLDILKDQWSPALTLKTALLSLQALLSTPEPDDPQDAVVAQQYLRNYQDYVTTARNWTNAFATGDRGLQEKVAKLVEMGIPAEAAQAALEKAGGDENAALEVLFSS